MKAQQQQQQQQSMPYLSKEVQGLVKKAREAKRVLDLANRGLGDLTTAELKAVCAAITGNKNKITTLHLDDNNLGNLDKACMQLLADGLCQLKVLTTLNLGPPYFEGTKDEWDALTEADRTSYLATEQVYDRIIGYSFFAANVFGISLWDFYATGDWVGALSKTGGALGVSMPVWDLPTLALSLRWPSELPLPQQLPLFVSASVAGLELLQRLWRWGAKRFGLSTADEIRARARKYRVLPQHGELGPPVRMDELTTTLKQLADDEEV